SFGRYITHEDSTFKIEFDKKWIEKLLEKNKEPKVFIKIRKPDGETFLDKSDILKCPVLQAPDKNQFEAVVVGSGFGGTIIALSKLHQFSMENNGNGTNAVL